MTVFLTVSVVRISIFSVLFLFGIKDNLFGKGKNQQSLINPF